jgi:meiosis-specific protein HOP1
MSTKQKVKSDQDVISKQSSLVLMKNMIRISISSISYMRGLFDDKCFKTIPYGGIDIHQLESAVEDDNGVITKKNNEAFQLTQWYTIYIISRYNLSNYYILICNKYRLERGVFDSIEKGYVSSMKFAIFTKHPISGLDLNLENYEFKMSYQNNNEPATVNGVPLVSKDGLKFQAKRFIRSLVEFTNTLDSLPDNRWLTIQLKYNNETPSNYQPEFFTDSDGSNLKFNGSPITVKIGGLDTSHYQMAMQFQGLESLLHEDLVKINLNETNFNQRKLYAKESSKTNITELVDDIKTPITQEKSLFCATRYNEVECANDDTQYNNVKQYMLVIFIISLILFLSILLY